jgi:hypothetical protein
LLLPFVARQGLRLRRCAPRFAAAAGTPHGRTGQGDPLRLLAIGDSIIAGAPTSAGFSTPCGLTPRMLSSW